jgi:poly-gamma-glutamate synthesis protein (capsule biosynthesis protein)
VAAGSGAITLVLVGDVMTGRGIDQILAHPSPPVLYESYVKSALDYVALAEEANGPIERRVSGAYIWGDALAELDRRRPDLRIINLETAVTRADQPVPKGINYRMNPDNVSCLTAAGVDCCVLANNHVLDWGRRGLLETLEVLERAGAKTAGVGRNAAEAAAPAVLPVSGKGRVLVYGFACPSSGVPSGWAATATRPGVNFLPEPSAAAIAPIAARIRRDRQPDDLVVVSIHWGPNWGYDVPPQDRAFAHGLIDAAAVDIVHGHSSHHAKAVELHNGKPIFYGCGDFLNDYEGIGGYEAYRGDLSLMYVVAFDADDRRLAALDMVPFHIRNFRLSRASAQDATWLQMRMDRECRRFGGQVRLGEDLALRFTLP